MLKQVKSKNTPNRGQSAIEYLLLFAAVVVVMYLGLNPNGFITKGINASLQMPVDLVEHMAENTYFNLEDE